MTDKYFICKMVEVQDLTQCMWFGPASIQSLAWNTVFFVPSLFCSLSLSLSDISYQCQLLPIKKVQNMDYFLLNTDTRVEKRTKSVLYGTLGHYVYIPS